MLRSKLPKGNAVAALLYLVWEGSQEPLVFFASDWPGLDKQAANTVALMHMSSVSSVSTPSA